MSNQSKRDFDPKQVILSALKIVYIILVVLAAVVVALYLVFKLVIKPPTVEEPPPVHVTVQPTDDPNTKDDETQQGPQVVQLERKEDFHTFLLIGTDDGNGNADTIMVGAYDVKHNEISVVSVPRDTLVDVSRKTKKINSAYGIGGVEQVLKELEPILGFRPDHYIMVDIQAFVDVVNLLGGVSFYVPEDMQHNDGAGFIIDLKEGLQWLNGDKALQLVRYRGYYNADLGRIQTQQKFLKELGKQVLSWSTVPKINEFAQVLSKYFKTDLSVTELAYFATQALTLDFSADLTFATLPGDGSVNYLGVSSYYELFPEQCYEVINTTVNPYTTPIPESLINILQVP